MAKNQSTAATHAKRPAAGRKIVPHLWFDKEAKQAAKFYTEVFPNSRITHSATLPDTPGGDTDVVAFELDGHPFTAISAGPLFRFNPSASFLCNFDPSQMKEPRKTLDAVWKRLAAGGEVRMPLDKYPFSERYGWVADKYGVNWQLMLTDPAGEPRPFILPALTFTGKAVGRAEEALDFWGSVFRESREGARIRYPKGMAPDKEGSLMFGDQRLADTWVAAMDSAPEHGHKFQFNEAVSLMVECDDQAEIDHYWKKLSADPKAEQCGWLKDKFGVSWQVTPREMQVMLETGTPAQVAAVTKAFLPMKKFDLAALRKAFADAATPARKPSRR